MRKRGELAATRAKMWAKAAVGAYHVSNSGASALWSVRRIASIQSDRYLVLESIQIPPEIAKYCSKRRQGGVVMARHVGAGGGGIFATLHDVVEHILGIEEPKPEEKTPAPVETSDTRVDALAERIASVVVSKMTNVSMAIELKRDGAKMPIEQFVRFIVTDEIEKQFGKL